MQSRVKLSILSGALALLIALPGFVAAAETAPAEQSAQLTVTVIEREGVVPGAAVLLSSAQTNQIFRRITGSDGVAIFPSVPAGTYDLKVSYVGFADYEESGIELAEGAAREIEVTLTMAQFSATVTVTTASRREELLREVATPTTLIDAADIEDTGGRSAKDVLIEQAGAGVLVHPGGGQGHVSINGISNAGVLVLVNGRRWLGRDGTGNFRLEDLDLSQVERIEIVKGAGSALYGSDALGGVINFITKGAPDYGVTNNLSVNYGSYGDARISDTVGFRGERGSGTMTFAYRRFDGYDLDPDDPQTIGLPRSEFYTLSGSGDVEIADGIVGRIFADFTRRDISDYFFSGPTQMGIQAYDSQRETTRYTLSPEVDILLGSNTTVNLGLTYSKYHREETRVYPTFTDEQEPWQEWNTQLNATGNHVWSAFGQDHTLQGGYEFRNERMDRASLVFPDTGEQETERDINVFWFQNEFSLSDQLNFTVGFRYDDYSDFGSEFSPKVSAMYALTSEHRLRASYGHGFRAPSFGELYVDLGFFFKGNPDLEPEISDTVTFGYSYTGDFAYGSIDYFRTRMQNGIVFAFVGFPVLYSYVNISEFTSQGINTSFSFSLPYGFTPSFSYSFVRREDDGGEELLNFPKHSGFFKLLWANPRLGLRANLRAQFMDQVLYTGGTSRPAYQMWYLRGSKRLFTSGRYSVDAFLQVENIFDRTDIFTRDPAGSPIPGDFQVWLPPRTFGFGITIDMDWAGSD